MTPDIHTNPKQMGTPKPYQSATPGSRSGSSDDHDTGDDAYLSCFQECLRLHTDCKRIFDHKTMMFGTPPETNRPQSLTYLPGSIK
jgi:hypothetical protein